VSRVLCVANQKGGVGKTTTSINLAAGLAKAGHATLLVDLDPQCNATTGLGLQPTMRHPLVHHMPLSDSVFETYVDRLHVLPGSRSFRDTNEIVRGVEHRQTLQYHLGSAADAYTYVVIDCPPSLGDLTQAALSASQEVVMPIQCEYFAMEGLTQMIEVIRRVMKQPGRNLEFGGIVLTMYDETLELTGEVEREVREFFGDIVFETVVPRDVTVSEAPSFGKSVLDHAPRSRGARAYIELCMEVMEQ
jgi:chromosome partitioning protein